MRTREIDKFLDDHPDLGRVVAHRARAHPDGTEADAITDLGLWPKPQDKDAQWLVWCELRKVRPVESPARQAHAERRRKR